VFPDAPREDRGAASGSEKCSKTADAERSAIKKSLTEFGLRRAHRGVMRRRFHAFYYDNCVKPVRHADHRFKVTRSLIGGEREDFPVYLGHLKVRLRMPAKFSERRTDSRECELHA
jgi:hypothetical protein